MACLKQILCSTISLSVQFQGLQISSSRTLYTKAQSILSPVAGCMNIQTRNVRRGTVKRRTTHPFKWLPQKESKIKTDDLTTENRAFLDNLVELEKAATPLRADLPADRPQWTPDSRRVGLVARKIGIYPMWKKNGKRTLTTVLQVSDNHVIKSYSAEEFKTKTIYQNRWASDGFGCIVVGSESADPRKFTAAYRGLFKEAGVMPKNKLGRFFVTDDALLQPGTPLDVRHFRVGDFVDVFGKTRDHGFQGAVKRWRFATLRDTHGTTKAHRRPGSISRGRKAGGPWRGKKMPGHMGSERRTLHGVKILRINYKYNVIYVQGPAVPGIIGSWVYIFDSKIFEKRHTADNPPLFPTHYADDSKGKEAVEAYDKDVHRFDENTVVFVETEAEKKVTRTGAKLAKVRTKS
ncbi:39S ribosomal protein L3, mitochondrial [Halotydeus destructor]|nr:39S ribosomal protein L3, mitochondrial [Halotydeus destructor]